MSLGHWSKCEIEKVFCSRAETWSIQWWRYQPQRLLLTLATHWWGVTNTRNVDTADTCSTGGCSTPQVRLNLFTARPWSGLDRHARVHRCVWVPAKICFRACVITKHGFPQRHGGYVSRNVGVPFLFWSGTHVNNDQSRGGSNESTFVLRSWYSRCRTYVTSTKYLFTLSLIKSHNRTFCAGCDLDLPVNSVLMSKKLLHWCTRNLPLIFNRQEITRS